MKATKTKQASVQQPPQAVEADRPCECNNCDWKGLESGLRCDLGGIEDLFERIDPGDEVPAGECPECGCLAFLVEQKKS